MAEFVSDCPRCGAEKITFDCYGAAWHSVTYSWKNYVEIFVVCRRCHRPSIQLVAQKVSDAEASKICTTPNELARLSVSLNDIVSFERVITLRDNHNYVVPEHLPAGVGAIVEEGNSCLASQCFNAAGAMYRLALDLSTKKLLLVEGEGPPAKARWSLGFRMEWLFDNGKIPSDLRSLATCLQQDGNDGAHEGTLTKADAEDLQDFCFELLRRLFTQPEKLRLADIRRVERRKPKP